MIQNTYSIVFIAVAAFFTLSPAASYAATSENYILDSASIGTLGSMEATSTNYRSDSTGYPVFYRGESIVEEDDEESAGESREGSRLVIEPRDTKSHLYTSQNPLILKDFQSGTLARSLENPPEFVTLYISPFATGNDPNATTEYRITRRAMDFQNIPQGIDADSILGGNVYVVSAHKDGTPITTLQRFLTLIIQNPGIKASADTQVVYFLHPAYKAWIKMPHPAFINGAVIFQTPYVTEFMVVQTNFAAAPDIVRTSETPDVPNETIQNDIRDTESKTIQNEMSELPNLPPIVENVEKKIDRTPQSFIEFVREQYIAYFVPLLLGLFTFLSIVLLVIRKNAVK